MNAFSFNVLMALFISIVLMYCPIPTGEEIGFFYRLFCNEFVLFVGFSIVMILYYSVLVIDPNCIENEAAKLKKKLSKDRGPAGSTTEFISLYDRIESICNELLPQNVLHQIHENKGKRFEYTIALLRETHPELKLLIPDLTRIHRYYECTINCTSMTVSQEMRLLAQCVLRYLENSSGEPQESTPTPDQFHPMGLFDQTPAHTLEKFIPNGLFNKQKVNR